MLGEAGDRVDDDVDEARPIDAPADVDVGRPSRESFGIGDGGATRQAVVGRDVDPQQLGRERSGWVSRSTARASWTGGPSQP